MTNAREAVTVRTQPPRAVEPLEPRTLLSVVPAANLNTDTFSSNPRDFVALGDRALFFAPEPGGASFALWRTDGTSAGTAPVKGGFAKAANFPNDEGFQPIAAGGRAFFRYPLTSTEFELWTTDGTAAGTVPLAAVRPGFGSDFDRATEFVAFGGRTYFNATDAAAGTELWSTDGTPGGTGPFHDVVPGPSGSGVRSLTVAGGFLFYQATEDGLTSLWRTDGTTPGTVRLGRFADFFSQVEALGDKAYFFAALPGEPADQLWVSDGTVDGTGMVVDLLPGGSAGGNSLTATDNALFFSAQAPGSTNQVLWRSDGTAANTGPVVPSTTDGTSPFLLTADGRQLFYIARDPAGGEEPWRSDGTLAGTYRLADIRPGTASSMPAWRFAPQATGDGGGAYLYAIDGTSGAAGGAELWFSDGRPAVLGGTYRVKDIFPGPDPSNALLVRPAAVLPSGRMVFSANDPATGFEPMVTGATAAGTFPLVDVETRDMNSDPTLILDAGGVALAVGQAPYALRDPRLNQRTRALFRVDAGVPSGAAFVAHAAPVTTERNNLPYAGRGGYDSATFGGRAYYFSDTGQGNGRNRLHSADGATAATLGAYYHPYPNSPSSRGGNLAVLGDRLYFAAYDAPNATVMSLFRTDGTEAGTERVYTSPSASAVVGSLSAGGGVLYFAAGNSLGRITNGMAAAELVADAGLPVVATLPVGGTVFLAAQGPTGRVLRAFDVAAATLTGTLSDYADSLTAFAGRAYYRGGTELYRSDGTAAGTTVVRAGAGGPPVTASDLRAVGDHLYFVSSDASHGSEWWRTDGTDAGTALLADAQSGPGGSDTFKTGTTPPTLARSIAVWRGVTYFTARTVAHGAELWRVDPAGGTPTLVSDLYPGPTGSDPAALTVVGDRLYVIATNPDVGREVFRVVDDVAPTVTAAPAFDPAGAGRVRLRLSEGVTWPAAGPGPTLTRTDGGPPPSQGLTPSFDPATNTLTLALPTGLLDGDYRLTVPAAWLTDTAGNPLTADVTVDFFLLRGDANRDRRVDFSDLVVLAQSYNQSGKTYAEGDFTGDGVVDFNDLVVLAQRYNTSLPAVQAPAITSASVTSVASTAKAKSDKPVFSTTPVAKVKPAPAKPKAVARPRGR